jgi:hypothetical protein
MMTETGTSIADADPVLAMDLGVEMVRQMRAIDVYDTYESWSPARILGRFVLT